MSQSFIPREERKNRRELVVSAVSQIIFLVLVVGIFFVLFYWLKSAEHTRKEARIRTEAKAALIGEELLKAIESSDTSRIRDQYDLLKEIDPVNQSLRHLIWITSMLTKDAPTSEKMKNELAPSDGQTGYGPSHFLAGQQMFATSHPTLDEGRQMLVHFRAAARSDKVSPAVHRYVGDVLFAMKQHGKAVQAYRKMKPLTADLQFRIATAIRHTDQGSKFLDEMRHASDLYEKQINANPSDDAAYVNWTRSLFHCGLVDKAETLLIARMKKDDNPFLRNALIQAYLAHLKFVGDFQRRKEMLQQICELDPDLKINPHTRQAFFELANHLVQENRFEEARAYYLISAKKIEFPISVKNNLAWVELMRPNGNLKEALKLADEAVAGSKTKVAGEVFGTRGQIHAKLGNWDLALVDLEKASMDAVEKSPSRLALAVVYRRLGENKKAEQMFILAQSSFQSLDELSKTYPQ